MAGKFIPNSYDLEYPFTVFHKYFKFKGDEYWMRDMSFDNMEEARKEAEFYSRNNQEAKICYNHGNDVIVAVSYFKDMQEENHGK